MRGSRQTAGQQGQQEVRALEKGRKVEDHDWYSVVPKSTPITKTIAKLRPNKMKQDTKAKAKPKTKAKPKSPKVARYYRKAMLWASPNRIANIL